MLEQHGPNMPMLDPNVPLDRAENGAEEAQSMNGDTVPHEPQPAAAQAPQYALPQIFRLRKMMMRRVPGIVTIRKKDLVICEWDIFSWGRKG